MSFLTQFSSYFNEAEKETELYKMWLAIGVNTEKAIYEEQNKLSIQMSDINNFDEDTYRSWLAFFLKKIPYRISAVSEITCKIINNSKSITIPKYAQLKNNDGFIFTQMNDLTIVPGHENKTTVVQGKYIVASGIYNDVIKIQATNPDLTHLSVKINGEEIPEVSYATSYDNLSWMGKWTPNQNEEGKSFGGLPHLENATGNRGFFYTVVSDGSAKFSESGIPIEFRTGDVVCFDGVEWQKNLNSTNISPIQFSNTYAIPRNGYFAYYYGNYLYVKVFLGNDVKNPQGQTYEVGYISSDGVQGETDENTLTYVSSYQDADGTTAKLEIQNTKSSSGVNELTSGKLGSFLKQRLYATINLSSIPEYTHWFNAQPEVGDCIILSDYERYLRSGKSNFQITNTINVFAINNKTNSNNRNLTDTEKDELIKRIKPYKDITNISFSDPQKIQHVLKFQYATTTNAPVFETFIETTARKFYDSDFLKLRNESLFDDLDLAAIIQEIQTNSVEKSTGLTVKGYHYNSIAVDTETSITIKCYGSEKRGDGQYIVYDADGNKLTVLDEVLSGDTCSIMYRGSNPTVVGIHDSNHNITIDVVKLKTFGLDVKQIECYWGMAIEGILSAGSDVAYRVLAKVEIEYSQK